VNKDFTSVFVLSYTRHGITIGRWAAGDMAKRDYRPVADVRRHHDGAENLAQLFSRRESSPLGHLQYNYRSLFI
jgi:hypothetical protein